jgi:hypothetical protein
MITSYKTVWDPKMYCSIKDLYIYKTYTYMMAQLGPKHVAEWKLHKGYRCVRRKTIVLCFKMEHIGTNKVKSLKFILKLKEQQGRLQWENTSGKQRVVLWLSGQT